MRAPLCGAAGTDPAYLFESRDEVAHWKQLYAGLPPTTVLGTEFLPSRTVGDLHAAPAAPQAPGRAKKKRVKCAIDAAIKSSHRR